MPSPNSPRDFLIAAKELISTPDRWTKHQAARNASGYACSTVHPDATCWCMSGALDKVGHTHKDSDLRSEAKGILKTVGVLDYHWPITRFNDHPDTTHTMVMDLFDKAITIAEGTSDGLK